MTDVERRELDADGARELLAHAGRPRVLRGSATAASRVLGRVDVLRLRALRRTPVGMIDLDDATVGDPVVDLVPLRRVLGVEASEDLVQGWELGDRVEARMRF
jgi:hypothetical protein